MNWPLAVVVAVSVVCASGMVLGLMLLTALAMDERKAERERADRIAARRRTAP